MSDTPQGLYELTNISAQGIYTVTIQYFPHVDGGDIWTFGHRVFQAIGKSGMTCYRLLSLS